MKKKLLSMLLALTLVLTMMPAMALTAFATEEGQLTEEPAVETAKVHICYTDHSERYVTKTVTTDVEKGTKIEVPEDPDNIGWVITGWHKMYTHRTWNFDEDTVNGEIWLCPDWERVNYTVTFKVNPENELLLESYSALYDTEGVALSEKSVLVKANDVASKTFTYRRDWSVKKTGFFTAEKKGYIFQGWELEDGSYLDMDTDKVQQDIVLVPVFEACTYNVHFVYSDTTETVQVMTYDEEKALKANKETKSGYTFKGWTTVAGSNKVVYADGETVVNLEGATGSNWCDCTQHWEEAGDVYLYPVWKENTTLLAKAHSVNNTTAKITWTPVKGATKYVVYGEQCGSKKMKNLGQTKKLYFVKKNLKKGKTYRFKVVAITKSGKKTSLTAHTILGGKLGKYGNVKSVSSNYNSVVLAKGNTKTIKSTLKMYNKNAKRLGKNHAAKFRYKTSDASVATFANGQINAKSKGSCYVYAVAVNGQYSKIKVTVR